MTKNKELYSRIQYCQAMVLKKDKTFAGFVKTEPKFVKKIKHIIDNETIYLPDKDECFIERLIAERELADKVEDYLTEGYLPYGIVFGCS